MRSNKPVAAEFQDWVTEEVLPSIRKTGKYELNKEHAQLIESKIKKNEIITKNTEITNNISMHEFFEKINDARAMAICADNLRNLATTNTNIKTIEDKSKLISISERIYNDMKRKPTKVEHNQLIKLGKLVSTEYQKRNNQPPTKCKKWCNGQDTEVNCYTIMDYETWIDGFIVAYYKWQ